MSEADRLRADIELTRAELSETVDALRVKLDVKVHARECLRRTLARAADTAKDNQGVLMLAGGGLAILLVLRRVR
jgi:uncharacterized membrane protein